MKEQKRKKLFSVTSKDCKWDYFRGGGGGGQKRDKTSNRVRCTHKPSGAVGKCGEHREQSKNKKVAFRRMAESKEFQNWIKIKAAGEGQIERNVEEAMKGKNIKTEVIGEEGKWELTT